VHVPLSWLREFVAFDLSPEQLAERLTLLGMEVKGIERIGADWASVVVGELLDVAPHPSAGRLSLTRVRTGDGRPDLDIVCGATNIAVGQRVPVALPGAVLPGDRRIEVTRIQGAESQGMLCSGAELGLTPDADGILILPGDLPLGAALEERFGDVVLDVDVKPNRGDALSILGLAREVGAALGVPVSRPPIEVPESGSETAEHVTVEVRDPVRCPRFVARYIDGVTVGPSPVPVQVRLMAAGIRPVSNVVDASNYVMVELGKPVHTFDASAVAGGALVVRASEPGERLETLDHVERELGPGTLLIADPTRPLAIAGVMGGASSEVGEGTSRVVVESAIFDPVAIRQTAFRYGLRTEASLRFEKGQAHGLARIGADRTAQLVVRWAGGRAAVGVVDTDPLDQPATSVAFRPSRIGRLLGVEVSTDEVRSLLEREGIPTRPGTAGDAVTVIEGERPVPVEPGVEVLVADVPPHRRDIRIEADMAEEVARIRGYETVPARLPDTSMPPFRPDPRRFRDAVRDLLAARGLSEVVSHALVAAADHARLGIPEADAETIRAANPLSADHSELRRSLLPELVRVLVDNERQRRDDVAIFEVGAVHRWGDDGPEERQELSILLAGPVDPPAPGQPRREADVTDLKGLLEWLVERLADGSVRYEPAPIRTGVDHPGRTALVVLELPSGHRVELGRVGELDPRFLAGAGARSARAIVATVDLEGLARAQPERIRLDRLERVPGADRDIAVVVDRRRPAGEVEAIIRAAGGPLLRRVRLFDRYEGPQVGPEEVSLAYRLRWESTAGPIQEADLDVAVRRITDALADRLAARLRG
jgi:phenylalanyl-tRNA synthetase beta chain